MAPKRQKSERGLEKVDWLSDLPNDLLHLILSFVDTKLAVQTSVLSRRWKCLWQSVPSLHFDSRCFTDDRFQNFVREVLTRRMDESSSSASLSNLSKLHICYQVWHLDEELLNTVINLSVSNPVQHLHLDAWCTVSSFPPLPMALNKSITTLELIWTRFQGPLRVLENSWLTSLYLGNCWFMDHQGECLDPFASCPSLKNLGIDGCNFRGPNLNVFKVSAPQLVNLDILNMCCDSFTEGCKVEILAPKLTSFCYKHSGHLNFSVLDLQSLDYVFLNTYLPCFDHDRKSAITCLINMFNGLSGAKSVELHSNTIEDLATFPDLVEEQHSPFANLKFLKLKYQHKLLRIPGKVLTYLLGGSPGAELQIAD